MQQRVLVVDDDHDTAEAFAEMLAAVGHETEFALDGPSAIAIAKAFLPQLILLDVALPDMDGYEVARQPRVEPCLSGAVLVAVTGSSGATWEHKAREAGFHHYLVKPVALAALQELLEA